MIERRIDIDGWKVDVFFCISHYVMPIIEDALISIDAPQGIVDRANEIANADEYNTGFTYSNIDMKRSVMVVGKTTSNREFLNTFVHEVRHLTDDIATGSDMPIVGEQVAYLAGDISSRLSDIVGTFVCNRCKRKTICRRL